MTPGRRPEQPSVPASASSRTCEPSPPIWCSRPGPPSLRPCAPDNPHPSSATDSPHPIYSARDPSNQWTANARTLKMRIAGHLGQVFHDLARRKECRIEEGHLMPDHVHMLISIPPKYSVAQIIGYEREEFDMDRAECRTQDAEFSGPQILGSPVLCHDRRSGRGGG